jgi:hypothetical protein
MMVGEVHRRISPARPAVRMNLPGRIRILVVVSPLLFACPGLSAATDPKISDAVRAGLPRYSAPVPTDAPVAGESRVLSDGTLVLPTMKVRPVAPRAPAEYEWLSRKGRLDLALRKFPGLQAGNLFGMNNGIALALLAEERQAQEKSELASLVRQTALVDAAESRRVRRLLEAALQRPGDDWQRSRLRW